MQVSQSSGIPIVASYIVTFLKPEMQHVYRQVCALRRWRPVVLCQKRENEEQFPFQPVRVLPKAWSRPLLRLWQKSILGGPVQISSTEAHKIASELRACVAEVLHVYFGHIGMHLLPLLEMRVLPTVVSFHGADAQVGLQHPRHVRALRRVFDLATILTVRSESLGVRLQAMGAPVEKIRIHRTGVPLDEIAARVRTAPPDGAWHCVQACRLIAKKGLQTTLRAFAAFAEHHPAARLTLAGEGPLRGELEALAQSLGCAEQVRFCGFLPQGELRALVDSAHFFLHPSEIAPDGDQEGVPNSMLEAMAAGVPVLATRHGGIPEAVEQNASGILVGERDDAALAAEITALAADPSRYQRMSAEAARQVAARFDLRATVPALEAIYDEARATRPAPPSPGNA